MDKKFGDNFSDNDLNGNEVQKVVNSELCGICITANQFKLKVFKPKLCNRDKALRTANDLIDTLDVRQLSSVMDEFNSYLIDDHYLVKKAAFRDEMFPRLQSYLCCKDEQKRFYAICLLLKILFDESQAKKSKLAKVAVKACLVTTLMKILTQRNTELATQKAIYGLLSLLFFVIAYNRKEKRIKNLILNDSETIILSVMRAQNEINYISINSIWLLQYIPLWSKNFEMLEPLLTTLKALIDHKINKVVIESCNTLMVFARNSDKSRLAIVKDKNLCKKLVEFLEMRVNCSTHPQEDIITPIVSILAVILPNHNAYRKAFVQNGLLNGVKNLLNCCHCYKRYGCDIIKWLCMTPLCDRLNKPIDIIDRILDSNVLSLLNQIIEQDLDMAVKYSAIYAIFMLTYNASYDQMVAFSEQGTLKSLCTQLPSNDNKLVHNVLVIITNILVCDFMEQLKNQRFPYPVETLSTFAEIIKANDGINLLTFITKREDIDDVKEIGKNKVIAQDLLAYGLGVELRAPRRIPTAVMMDYEYSHKDCILCYKTTADTYLFQCQHNVLCKPCASKLLYKILIFEKPNACPVKDCNKEAKLSAAPFGVIRTKMHYINRDLEKEVEGEFVNECAPIRKVKLTICSVH